MSGRVCYLVLVFVRPGQEELLREYERRARPIMRRHGGDFERVMKPVARGGEASGPHEVHLLHFDSAGAFDAFRSDPELQRYTALRDAAVERAELLTLTDIALPEYFGTS